MDWNHLSHVEQLNEIDTLSNQQAVLIFKHSTRCGISTAALSRIERKWSEKDKVKLKPYYLDLLKYRELSSAISQRYKIEHQSPQALVIKEGQCVYSRSHMSINYSELIEVAG